MRQANLSQGIDKQHDISRNQTCIFHQLYKKNKVAGMPSVCAFNFQCIVIFTKTTFLVQETSCMNARHLLEVLHSIRYLGKIHSLCGRPAQQPVSH